MYVPSLEVKNSVLRHQEFASKLKSLIFQTLEIYKEILCITYQYFETSHALYYVVCSYYLWLMQSPLPLNSVYYELSTCLFHFNL